MSERIGRKKSAASTFTNPSLTSQNIPTLANPIHSFGSPINTAPPQTVTQVAPDLPEAQSDQEQLLEPEISSEKSLTHDISRISLHRPQTKLKVGEQGNHSEIVQRSSLNVIQRTPAIDGTSFSTFADLGQWYAIRLLKLISQQTEMNTDSVPAPVSVQGAIDEGKKNAQESASRGEAAVDTDAALKAQIWFDFKYVKAMNEAEAEKAKVAAARMKETEEKVKAAETQFNNVILPTLQDQQRASFRQSNDSSLLSLADTIATALDTSLVMKDTILAISAERAVVENMVNVANGYKGLFPSANSKAPAILGCAEKVNALYAKFQLVRAGIDLFTSKKTSAAAGASGVKAMSTIVGAGGTLLGASAGMTLYANLYIGPMVDACLVAIEKITDLRSKGHNRECIEMGMFDLVNWSIEPGGRPVFNFMLEVMKAGDVSGVPTPVPKTVASYFVDNEDQLNAGVGGKNDMPTKGFWFLEEVDKAKIASWVFSNRSNIWGMLYGAAKPPV